jgi:cyclopropane-fatty-acyl-phospholipid synthase
MALYLARVADVEVLGITLSREQLDLARERAAASGLADRVRCELMDYRDVTGTFDRVTSVGMMEHVGKAFYRGYFRKIREVLKPDGIAVVHTMARMGGPGTTDKFMQKHIFPGGYLPTLPEIVSHLSALDFHIWEVENLAPHYRLTLDQWSNRFEGVVPSVAEKCGEKFVRMVRLYLRVSSAAFRVGEVEVHQILVSRGQPDDLPLTREDIYKEQKQC